MKLPWLALLCFGTVAICQSPSPRKFDPDKLFQMPDKFAQHMPDFKTLKPLPPMKNELILPQPTVLSPRPKLNDPQIDPKIILHPPWHSQSKGQDVAHHLYPDLKFLPLERGPRIQR